MNELKDFYNLLKINMTFANKAAKSGDKQKNEQYVSHVFEYLKNFKFSIYLDFSVKFRKLENGLIYFIRIQTDEIIVAPERSNKCIE